MGRRTFGIAALAATLVVPAFAQAQNVESIAVLVPEQGTDFSRFSIELLGQAFDVIAVPGQS